MKWLTMANQASVFSTVNTDNHYRCGLKNRGKTQAENLN